MSTPRAFRQSTALRLSSAGFLTIWCLIAAFPIFWIAVMSFKEPIDAFSANPLNVIFGPVTRARGSGLSVPDILAGIVLLVLTAQLAVKWLPGMRSTIRSMMSG